MFLKPTPNRAIPRTSCRGEQVEGQEERLGNGLDHGVETYDVTEGVQSNSEPTLKSDG